MRDTSAPRLNLAYNQAPIVERTCREMAIHAMVMIAMRVGTE